MKKFIYILIILAFAGIANVQSQSVQSVTPSQNAINIPLTSDIKSYFNQSMDGSTISGSSVKFYGSMTGKKQGTITYNTGNNSVQIVPNNPFKYGEFVSTTLNSGIKTSSGNPITPFVWNFTTMSNPANISFNVYDKVNTGAGTGPAYLVTGDFDGDGDLDLAIILASVGSVSIIKNNGIGSFTQTSTVSVKPSSPTGIVSGDFDGDGDLDLAVSHYHSSDVAILINDGSGSFTVASFINAPGHLQGITSADFDGDGDIDIAVTNYYGLIILINNGAGTFSVKSGGSGIGSTKRITSGDFDGDGDIDIALSSWDGNPLLYICKNNGSGDFTLSSTIAIAIEGITSADYDGDGDIDISVTGGANVSILKNNGNGAFTISSTYSGYPNFMIIIPADFDGDGDVDFVASDVTATLFKNNGAGSFTSSVIYTENYIYGLAAGDFNLDGVLDLSIANHISSTVYILSKLSRPQYISSVSPNQNAINVPLNSDIKSYFNQSMNGSTIDGNSVTFFGSMTGKKQGTITYNVGSNSMQIVPNNPFKVGEFVSTTLNSGIKTSSGYSITPFVWNFTAMSNKSNACFNVTDVLNTGPGTGPWRFITGDFDGDGDLDLAVLYVTAGSVAILKNNGGAFTQTSTIYIGSGLEGITTGDYDRDGDLDIAVSKYDYDPNNVVVLSNDGSGTFIVSQIIPAGPYLFGITSADFDGDGDIDIAISGYYTGLSILINNGAGTFTKRDIGIASTVWMTSADFDGDGDIDVALGTMYGNSLYICKNNGYGEFTLSSTVNIPNWEIVPADFDGDGDVDIAVTGHAYGGDPVSILKNNGSGEFTISSTFPGCPNPLIIIPADFDGDGDMDLVTSFVNVILYKNNSAGSFTSSIIYTGNTGDLLYGLAAGDFNRDAVLDLAVSNNLLNTVSILSNLSSPQLLSPANNSTGIPLNFTWKKSAGALNYNFQIATDSLFNNLVENSTLPGTDSVKYVSGLSLNVPRYYWRMNSLSAVGASLWSDTWKFSVCRQLNVSLDPDQTIYYGYGAGNATLNVNNVSGGSAPYTYLWSPGGQTSQSIVVNPTVTTNYTVTVTDQNGCTGNGSVTVTVVDVRCGNKNDKVLVCHKGNTICISPNAVPAHLAHGDYLGNCGDQIASLPTEFELQSNYPNPFNPTTRIEYSLPFDSKVNIQIFDVTGRVIVTLVNDNQKAGYYSVDFNASNLASGIYFYRMAAGDFTDTKRMLLIK